MIKSGCEIPGCRNRCDERSPFCYEHIARLVDLRGEEWTDRVLKRSRLSFVEAHELTCEARRIIRESDRPAAGPVVLPPPAAGEQLGLLED